MSFVGRALSFFFELNNSQFVGGQPTIKIPPGLRASARIAYAGLPSSNALELTIWGLTADIMNQLNTLGMQFQEQPRNLVTVMAGDAGISFPSNAPNTTVAFKGAITDAWPEFNRQPEAPIYIQAYAGADMAVTRALPRSFPGESDIVQIVSGLATLAKKSFENNGVTGVMLSNQYLWGSPLDQIKAVARAVKNRGVSIDVVENDIVAMWYTKQGRGKVIPLVSPSTGLIGYPTYSSFGIDFRCVYNPNLRQGGQVQVQSFLKGATGLFDIYGLSHDLDSQIPGGKWETTVHAARQGYPTPPLPPP